MNENIQNTYEKIVSLSNTNDLCYRAQMQTYREYIEQNFSVQTILEFPDYEYGATWPLTTEDVKYLNQ